MEVFDGLLPIEFHQAYVCSSSERPTHEDFDSGFYRGQRNGLLGAAVDGFLFLTTGTQNGDVRLAARAVEQEPRLDDSWEEYVEASFVPETTVVAVFDWDRLVVCEIPLGDECYRVRYTGRGMDLGHANTGREVHGLWFWPAPAAPDAILRQTSQSAAYWHDSVKPGRM